MITRLGRYILGSYPPALYVPYALAWALGVSALFAVTDPRVHGWRLDGDAAIAAVTFVITLLLVRAVDDIRDLEYDRAHNPQRPLARGAVRVADLVTLIAVGSIAVLALNSGRGVVALMLAAQLGYTVLILVVDQKWRWPSGDALMLSSLVSLPVQVLLNLYLYAGVLHGAGLGPSEHGVLPLLAAIVAFVHVEYARKTTRNPAAGERSYVTLFGHNATAAIALVAAIVSVVLALVPMRVSTEWLLFVPLVFPAWGAYRFWHGGRSRWPVLTSVLFLLTTFGTYLVLGLVGVA
jgi:4-hydroxybenzoate polyprenyltransferase